LYGKTLQIPDLFLHATASDRLRNKRRPAGSLGNAGIDGAPDRIRTCDLCLRRAALYPAELRVLSKPKDGLENRPANAASNGFLAEAARSFNAEMEW
jgi:hypothetical protein